MKDGGRLAIPDPITKRDVLFGGETPPEGLDALGDVFVDERRLSEALDCFEQSRNRQRLLKLKELLIEDGDVMLLERLEKVTKEKFGEKEWKEIARRAEALGKDAYARRVAARFEPKPDDGAPEAQEDNK